MELDRASNSNSNNNNNNNSNTFNNTNTTSTTTPPNNSMQAAATVLTQFKEHPDSWMRVDSILERSQNPQTKFFGLVILEQLIATNWKKIGKEQCEGIKNFIVSLIIRISSDQQLFNREKVFLNKLDIIFVQILKNEWPNHWSTFIPEIVNSSKTNESLCENNMNILKLLSEEVFNFSEEKMTQVKIQSLKINFEKEFSLINELCQFILENGTRPSLIKSTLKTLQRFLNWIPLHYIIEKVGDSYEPSKLVKLLLFKFFPDQQYRSATIKCLTEIVSLSISPQYDPVFVAIIDQFMKFMKSAQPDPSKIPEEYENGDQMVQNFFHTITIFLTQFFKSHLKMMENPNSLNIPYLTTGHEILVSISNIDDIEIFKICLDYWNFLASNLYSDFSTYHSLMTHPPRVQLYKSILSKVRVVLIDHMARPEEVIITEDENGNIVRDTAKDTDALALYEVMRETLIFLTHLDSKNTEDIMLEKLKILISGKEWSFQKVNTLCWAIGSISGSQNKDQEKRFLIIVIKDLLELTLLKRGKDNKAVIASDIMYIVGQYPRFLKDHWKFLKTVVNKLFEFMHEPHPGVQDMACDTFLKISKSCRRKFVILQLEESQIFINELLGSIQTIISDLNSNQVHTFYEAVGYMISSSTPEIRDKLVYKLMELPNQSWYQIMGQANINVENLLVIDVATNLVNLLKTNHRAAISLGNCYIVQMSKIYLDLLNVYRTYSDHLSKNPSFKGHHLGMKMRSVKKETLKLLSIFIEKVDDKKMVYQHFIPPLLEAVLGDYRTNTPEARDPEVLSLMTVIITSLKRVIHPDIPKILEAVFETTLNMITKNFEDFPEHRINFFNLIRAINQNAFSVFHNLSPEQFKLLIDCIVWAFKHTERNMSETGLYILKELMENVSSDQLVANAFFNTYLVPLLNDILFILTDSFHKSGFVLQCDILKMMFQSVEMGIVKIPLYDQSAYPNIDSNSAFIKEVAINFLSSSPNLTRAQVQSVINRLFTLININNTDFNIAVRDFLIQLKEFQGSENVELFSEEKNLEKEALLKRQQAIPGMIKINHDEMSMSDL
eukprot:gene2416-2983_t